MVPVTTAAAVENLGLERDIHALPDSSRQVLLIESETLAALGLAHGVVKENITTSGIALMGLRRGKRLLVGTQVILEATKACSPCVRMDELRPGLLREIDGRRGMFARVIRGGTIARGDSITTLGE